MRRRTHDPRRRLDVVRTHPETSAYGGALLRLAGWPGKCQTPVGGGTPAPSAERPVGYDARFKSSASAEGPREASNRALMLAAPPNFVAGI